MKYVLVKILVNTDGNYDEIQKIDIRIKWAFSVVIWLGNVFEGASLSIWLNISFHISFVLWHRKLGCSIKINYKL